MSHREQNGDSNRCGRCASLLKEVKSLENKRVELFLFFKQKIINFDKLIRTLLQQKSATENECRALKAQVDHLWPCQQENEQLKESKRGIEDTIIELKNDLDSKETTIFQLNAKFSEAEREKTDMLSELDVYKVAYLEEKKKNERLTQRLNKTKELSQEKRKLAKLLKESTQKQAHVEEKLASLKLELGNAKKESKRAEKQWRSVIKSTLSHSQLPPAASETESGGRVHSARKRRRKNAPPRPSPSSHLLPEPSEDSSQSNSDSELSDVSQVSSMQSLRFYQSLEDAIHWTLPAMSPLRTLSPQPATEHTGITIDVSTLPLLSPLHSSPTSPANPPPTSTTTLHPLNTDLQISSSSDSNSSSSSSSSSPLSSPPLSPSLRKKLLQSKSQLPHSPLPSPLASLDDTPPAPSSRVTRSLAKQLNISIPALQENTPDPPKVTSLHSRSRTTSENAASDLSSPCYPPPVPTHTLTDSITSLQLLLTDTSTDSVPNSAQKRESPAGSGELQTASAEDHDMTPPLLTDGSCIEVMAQSHQLSPTADSEEMELDTVPDSPPAPHSITISDPLVPHSLTVPDPLGPHSIPVLDPLALHSPTVPDPLTPHSPTIPDPVAFHFPTVPDPPGPHSPTIPDPLALHSPTVPDPPAPHSPTVPDPPAPHSPSLPLSADKTPRASMESMDTDNASTAEPRTTRSRARHAAIVTPPHPSPPSSPPLASPSHVPPPNPSPRRSARLTSSHPPPLSFPLLSPPSSICSSHTPHHAQPQPVFKYSVKSPPLPLNAKSPPLPLNAKSAPPPGERPAIARRGLARVSRLQLPVASKGSRSRSGVQRRRKTRMRKSKSQCLHSLERDRQSKPVPPVSLSILTPGDSSERRQQMRRLELPTLVKGSKQLEKSPSTSAILSDYLKQTSSHTRTLSPPASSATATSHSLPLSRMKTKKVTNLLALSDDQPPHMEVSRPSTSRRSPLASRLSAAASRGTAGSSGGESDVEMCQGPTERMVGRGRQRRRIKSKVYISESEELSSDQELPPDVTAQVTELEEISYDVTAQVTELEELSYDVTPQVTELEELSYDVTAQVTELEEISYDVTAQVTELEELSYDVTAQVTELEEISYDVTAQVTELEELSYDVTAQFADLELHYDVTAHASEVEVELREESAVVSDESCVASHQASRDPTQLSRVDVEGAGVCLSPGRMRTLFPLPPSSRSKQSHSAPHTGYSLESLGFYEPLPLPPALRIKQELIAAATEEESAEVLAPGSPLGLIDLIGEDEEDVDKLELIPQPDDGSSSDEIYVSPFPSPRSYSTPFSTPSPQDRKEHLVDRLTPSHSPTSTPATHSLAEAAGGNLRITRSGNKYRSYIPADFSNEESTLPFASILSTTDPLPQDSSPQDSHTPPSTRQAAVRPVVGSDYRELSVLPDPTPAPAREERMDTTLHMPNYVLQKFQDPVLSIEDMLLSESTTITELVSSYTFSSQQSTSELFQASKSKFQAQTFKQKQSPTSSHSQPPRGTQRGSRYQGKGGTGRRGERNFPAKRGYVVGQEDNQDTDSDDEIDCMLQELRQKGKKKPDKHRTAAKKSVTLGVLKRNEEQTPYAYVVKTLERLRLGTLKVQDILLMLKNPENIHSSLPIIQGVIKFIQMLPVAVEDTISQLIMHVSYYPVKKNKPYSPPDKLPQIGIPEEEPLLIPCLEDTWLDLTYWTRHGRYERDVILPTHPSYPPILAPFEAQLIFLILECNKAPHLGARSKYPLLQTLLHCLECVIFGIKSQLPKITAIYTYSRLSSACRILTAFYRFQENIDKMAYFIMALPLQRLDFSVADILLYQSIAIVWPKLLRVLPDQIVKSDNGLGYRILPNQVFLMTMVTIFASILFNDYTLQVYYPCFTALELMCDWMKPNAYWPEDTMNCYAEELISLLISNPEVRVIKSGCRMELSPVANRIVVSIQTIAKVKDSQWVHKCLVHKLLMPAFTDWASSKELLELIGLNPNIEANPARLIQDTVAMCIISVFGYLKKLRFIRDERQPPKQQSLLINILLASTKSVEEQIPISIQQSCADALLDILQVKSTQSRDITRCLTSWYKHMERSRNPTDPFVQLYNAKLQALENQRNEL